MTIDQAFRLTRFILNKDQNGYFPADQWNLLAPIAQLSVVNNRIGNLKQYQVSHPVPPVGFNVSQKAREDLRPLMVAPTTRTVTAGVSAYPDNYLYLDSMMTAAGYIIKEATEDEIEIMNKSVIMPPIATFPKYVMHADGFYIYPTSITSIKLSWLRKPVDPVWGYTIVNNVEVYDSGTSQDFEVSDTVHLEIVMLILQMSGMSINMLQVTQFAAAMEAQGK